MEDSGMPVLPISVNLSSADFDHVDPLDVVERVVRKYRLPRSYIRIEITESALVKDGKKLQREIDRFRKAGYQCWMDDFGSGYSSFNVLQNFHFDELKIDMAFLRNFNDQSRKIIKSIVLMAKSSASIRSLKAPRRRNRWISSAPSAAKRSRATSTVVR